METAKLNQVFTDLLEHPEIKEHFSFNQLQTTVTRLTSIIEGVVGNRKVKEITFHDDDKMFFDLNANTLHIGLGILAKMAETWFQIMTKEGEKYQDSSIIREKILSSLRSDAAHEAGHRVIDRNPVKDLGIPQETWGQLGISSLANSLMDCRNDHRIAKQHSEYESDMRAGLEFGFGPNGRLDWPEGLEDQRLNNGYNVLFTQFDCETIRLWATGEIHPETDSRVKGVLENHKEDILFAATDKTCVPSKDPSELEVRAKARQAYSKVAKIYNGDYKNILLQRDKDNQAIHQALTVVGLNEAGEELHPKLKKFLQEQLKSMGPALKQELDMTLQNQKEEKEEYEKSAFAPRYLTDEYGKRIRVKIGLKGYESKKTKAGGLKQEINQRTPLEMLGPAIQVEQLSDELRDYLKKLFEDMRELMQLEIMQQMLDKLLQELLENPEKALKEIEDALNEQLRPHTAPPTVPTHKELENMPPESAKSAPPTKLIKQGGSAAQLSANDMVYATPRELEATEKWLEEHIDMRERIEAWRDAIYSVIKSARKKTARPKPRLHGPALIRDEIRKTLGHETSGKVFLDIKAEKRERITLSVLWRTQAIALDEALKLFVFLKKIYEDEEIRKYLDLEILISQEISKTNRTDGETNMPVIICFGQDPVTDNDKIIDNLLAIQKTTSEGGAPTIVQDADALKLQRERLLAQNPGAKRKFAIDLWDEAAIQHGATNPMRAVQKQIERTQEELHGHAFCFVLKESGASSDSPGKWYGKDHYLVENSTEKLIQYLDIVVRTMIQYPDNYAVLIKERIEKELNIYLE